MRRFLLPLCTGLLIVSVSSLSQDRWSWPEKPQNLKQLPKEFTGDNLRPVMTGFTRALGVRCSYCHVGEEGKPLSTYDFASDANPNKDRARVMLAMLGDINTRLKSMDKSGEPINMWCHTCHHGRPKPATLEEELGAVYKKDGIEPAVAHYTDLKDKYYGRGVYDFSENGVNRFGYEVLRSGDVQGAIKVFTMMTQEHPESANAWDSLAEGYMKAGDMAKAKEYYEKSLSLNPSNRNAKQMLEKIASEMK